MKKNDLISRSTLSEELKSLTVTVTGLRAGKGVLHEYAKQYRDTLLRIIAEQPIIEAVPVVHGRWMPHKRMARSPLVMNYSCSVCGKDGNETNFCPNCGAKMKE